MIDTLKKNSLESLCRCVFAIKPIPAENPANVTRNIVFQEVLDGVRQAVPVSVTPTAATQEVEDITEWNDYEAIEVEMENTLDEDAVAEEGPLSQEETRQRVKARRKAPSSNQRQLRRDVSPPRVWLEADEPLSEYEEIRESNIREREALFYEQFGYHLRDERGILAETLGQEEGDSELDDEEEQV